ncbi:Zn-dependent hydrolase, glyoxylase [Fervidobacterium pennivorans DSM 9078]|uniref:Zn-dependent hydrolase, glyoxylase n=1 Tax=Fervidobacterium pennivorans (strain DSM 9078 / Ven5) TaxID=771875 RepID=H9UEN5_FERPD|nr:MBL fold metallo-hydrolase [Fervidobacterium pennivorans]AFG35978.1 Zn-dependent hydrolase, glyoxylase [Fervidobacterium pennivorans DSM 9078]
MYEIIDVTESVKVLRAPVNVVFYFKHNMGKIECLVIDTGSSSEYGKKIQKYLESQGVTKLSILNSHFHADHIGGNSFLQGKTKCKIYTTDFESVFIEHPQLEPMYLWGGPLFEGIDNKFLMAKPSIVTDIVEYGWSSELDVEIIPLKGHSFDMVGILIDDGAKRVLFVADAVVSMQTIEKYKVYFLYDVREHLKTLQGLNKWVENIDVIVPSHGEIFDFSKDNWQSSKEEFLKLVRENGKVIEDILNFILRILVEPMTIDEILSEIASNFSIPIDATSYVLLLQTLKAYCSYLVSVNEVGLTFEREKLEYIRMH